MRQGDPQHPLALAPDKKRRAARSRRPWQQLAVAGLVELPVEVDRPVAQQRPDDREGLLEPAHEAVVREAEGPELGLVPAGTQAEDQAAATDLVHGGGKLREHGRSVERR